ncbi:TonB-dependent receptor [Sunxiuqinia rutila]|uniref:TonB-dependent receptor n=1 Tax=Sunxiuqinia rutila TaxID=1397841 RepID=UPI003D36A87C
MKRILIIGSLFLISSLAVWAQNQPIVIEADNQPLTEVLVQLRDRYGFLLSYNASELATYTISLSESYPNQEDALRGLLEGLPLRLKKSRQVFIILSDRSKASEPPERRPVSGQIVEAKTGEPLPFSALTINQKQLFADVNGSFNYTTSGDSLVRLKVSHLGYYVLDTLLKPGINQRIELIPSFKHLPEVRVENNVVEKAAIVGEKSGNMKLNHSISRFLAGQGDNAVFNLLKLMPGIQASNEQTVDLYIWGSYEGQSQISFDDFTLFGLKEFNTNISLINPFLVKNIEVYKGGYEARYGNRVGGLVNIQGKTGNPQKPGFQFNINPMTLNGMAELPVGDHSSLIVAYRQTYYNPYSHNDFNLFGLKIHGKQDNAGRTYEEGEIASVSVFPDRYQFRDFNVKYTANISANDQLGVSAYYGGDDFSLSTANRLVETHYDEEEDEEQETSLEVLFSSQEENRQLGTSLYYSRDWANGNRSRLVLAHSSFRQSILDLIEADNLDDGEIYNRDWIEIENEARESAVRLENSVTIAGAHQLEFGGGFFANEGFVENSNLYEDPQLADSHVNFKNQRFFLFVQDNLPLMGRLTLRTGLRLNKMKNKLLMEPRMNLTYQLSESLKINGSWGIYNQFIYKTAYVDRDDNYTYLWTTGDEHSGILHAMHGSSGINFSKPDFTMSVEAYYKTTDNLSRYRQESRLVGTNPREDYYLYRGDSKAYGLDVYLKKDFGKHAIWGAYTLSETRERLAYEPDALGAYQAAPHDQRHELKLAGLYNLNQFYLSANYVYGSGLYILQKQAGKPVHYKRLDAAVTYRFNWRLVRGETGLSVLNLLDTRNVIRGYLTNVKISEELGTFKIYTDAMPLMPILFLKLAF